MIATDSLALSACCKPDSSILYHAGAHINTDEAGAPEFFTNGAKLLAVEGDDAKITAEVQCSPQTHKNRIVR